MQSEWLNVVLAFLYGWGLGYGLGVAHGMSNACDAMETCRKPRIGLALFSVVLGVVAGIGFVILNAMEGRPNGK